MFYLYHQILDLFFTIFPKIFLKHVRRLNYRHGRKVIVMKASKLHYFYYITNIEALLNTCIITTESKTSQQKAKFLIFYA